MWISDFWCGVIATVVVELILCILLVMVSIKKGDGDDKNS
jgi:predicted small integral membrane protein